MKLITKGPAERPVLACRRHWRPGIGDSEAELGQGGVYPRHSVFSLLLLFSVRQIVRAFSAGASRADFLEERDERNRCIKLKTAP